MHLRLNHVTVRSLLLGAVGAASILAASCVSDDEGSPVVPCGAGCADASLLDVGSPDATTADGGLVTDATDASADDATTSDAGIDANEDAAPDAAADAAVDAADGAVVDAGPIQTLATGQGDIFKMVVGGGYVYFERYGGGTLGRVPTAGGPAVSIPLLSIHGATQLAVDANNFYYATSGGEAYKVPHGSTTAQKIADLNVLAAARAIASDGTFLYWTQQDGLVGRIPIGAAVPSDGGGVTFTTTNYPTGVAITGGTVFLSEHGPTNAGQIDRVEADGGITPIFKALYDSPPGWLTTDGNRLYWIENEVLQSPTPIESVLLDGGGLRRYSTGATYARIATDGVSLYYMEGGVGSAAIMKGAVEGTGATIVPMTKLYGSFGYTSSTLAVDATSLYWGDYDNGVLYKAPK